jgi:ABC-type sugar transport system ATPase subunit
MSDSILDKIRSNRKRTIVPNREDTLIAPKQESEQIAQRSATSANATSTNETSNETTNSNSTLEELKAELAKIPQTRRHSAVVLDAEIDANLTRFCKEKGVTVEVFLEAAWLQAEASSELMEKILVEAKCRYDSRKLAGKLRRLITMLSGR